MSLDNFCIALSLVTFATMLDAATNELDESIECSDIILQSPHEGPNFDFTLLPNLS